MHLQVAREADLTKFTAEVDGAPFGTMVLWWQSQYVLAASSAQIADLRKRKRARPNACVRALLTLLPEEPIAMARCDAFFHNLVGVPARGWLVGLTIGHGRVSGRVTAVYSTPEEATAALNKLASRSFSVVLPQAIEDLIASLPSSVAGNLLHLEFDMTGQDIARFNLEDMERLTRERPQPR